MTLQGLKMYYPAYTKVSKRLQRSEKSYSVIDFQRKMPQSSIPEQIVGGSRIARVKRTTLTSTIGDERRSWPSAAFIIS